MAATGPLGTDVPDLGMPNITLPGRPGSIGIGSSAHSGKAPVLWLTYTGPALGRATFEQLKDRTARAARTDPAAVRITAHRETPGK